MKQNNSLNEHEITQQITRICDSLKEYVLFILAPYDAPHIFTIFLNKNSDIEASCNRINEILIKVFPNAEIQQKYIQAIRQIMKNNSEAMEELLEEHPTVRHAFEDEELFSLLKKCKDHYYANYYNILFNFLLEPIHFRFLLQIFDPDWEKAQRAENTNLGFHKNKNNDEAVDAAQCLLGLADPNLNALPSEEKNELDLLALNEEGLSKQYPISTLAVNFIERGKKALADDWETIRDILHDKTNNDTRKKDKLKTLLSTHSTAASFFAQEQKNISVYAIIDHNLKIGRNANGEPATKRPRLMLGADD